MIDWYSLIKKAREQERTQLIPFMRYKAQGGVAIYTEIKNVLYPSGLAIKKTIEKRKEKKTNNFFDFQKLNDTKQVITKY